MYNGNVPFIIVLGNGLNRCPSLCSWIKTSPVCFRVYHGINKRAYLVARSWCIMWLLKLIFCITCIFAPGLGIYERIFWSYMKDYFEYMRIILIIIMIMLKTNSISCLVHLIHYMIIKWNILHYLVPGLKDQSCKFS